MLLTITGAGAVILMTLLYVFRRPAIGFLATMFWIIFAIQARGMSTVMWDVYYGMFWGGIAAVVITVLEALVVRPKKAEQEPEEFVEEADSKDKWDRRYDQFITGLESMRRGTRAYRQRRARDRLEEEELRRQEIRRKLRSRNP